MSIATLFCIQLLLCKLVAASTNQISHVNYTAEFDGFRRGWSMSIWELPHSVRTDNSFNFSTANFRGNVMVTGPYLGGARDGLLGLEHMFKYLPLNKYNTTYRVVFEAMWDVTESYLGRFALKSYYRQPETNCLTELWLNGTCVKSISCFENPNEINAEFLQQIPFGISNISIIYQFTTDLTNTGNGIRFNGMIDSTNGWQFLSANSKFWIPSSVPVPFVGPMTNMNLQSHVGGWDSYLANIASYPSHLSIPACEWQHIFCDFRNSGNQNDSVYIHTLVRHGPLWYMHLVVDLRVSFPYLEGLLLSNCAIRSLTIQFPSHSCKLTRLYLSNTIMKVSSISCRPFFSHVDHLLL